MVCWEPGRICLCSRSPVLGSLPQLHLRPSGIAFSPEHRSLVPRLGGFADLKLGRAGGQGGRGGQAGAGRAGLLGVGSPLPAAPVSLFSASEANGSVILEGPRLRGGGVLGRLITGCRAACSLAGNSQGFRHGPPSARPCWGSSCRLSAVATVDPGLSGQVSMRSYPKWKWVLSLLLSGDVCWR